MGHLWSLRVTHFDTNRKLICDFLLVNNTNWCPLSHCFWVMAEYWTADASIYLPRSWWPQNCGLRNLASKKLETSLCSVVCKIFQYTELFRCGSQVWWTDRRTELRLEFEPFWALILEWAGTKPVWVRSSTIFWTSISPMHVFLV